MASKREQFLKDFEFDHWANDRYLKFIEENSLNNERVNRICGHILSAQILWLKRIQPVEIPEYPLWKNYEVTEMSQLNETSFTAWKKFISEYEDDSFSEIISYTNTKGLSFDTPLQEIIIHVLYHGAYHRGQLAILTRAEGFDPPYTDYIAFVRGQ